MLGQSTKKINIFIRPDSQESHRKEQILCFEQDFTTDVAQHMNDIPTHTR